MTNEQPDAAVQPQVSLPVESPAAEPTLEAPNRFATAGKLGAERVHRLMRLGQLYEQEHGLKRGRQRLRQLIQLGKRYEQEHGIAAPARRPRPKKGDVWADFVRALARVVKPAYVKDVERLAGELRAAVAETPIRPEAGATSTAA